MIWNGLTLPDGAYYSDADVVIYHADARDILPLLPKVDLVLTDPPYNAGKAYDGYNDQLEPERYAAVMREIVTMCHSLSSKQAWVAPRYQMALWLSLLPAAHLIVVRRGARGPFRQGWSDQFETILIEGPPSYPDSDLWDGIRLKGEGCFFREDTFGHPGYTPYPILSRCIHLLTLPGDIVLDPFGGTGTATRASKDHGRKCILIEQSEAYCAIAARRMAQTVMPLEAGS